jgi:DNA (cytosine-5)-methyltransferase 1
MNRIEFQQNAINALSQIKGLTVAEREELAASVTHWMQTPHLKFPFLSAKMRRQLAELAGTGAPVFQYNDVPYPPPPSSTFTFVDLFAGIGGFRQAFQNLGGKCVFTSEWDEHAKKTYTANYGEVPYGDICRIDKAHIPDHDVLCAGFPCQPFSLAGVSKKNSLGRKHGFEDETQGTLFFEIKEILRIKKPKAFFLENVKNLLSHDRGKTFEVIRHWLEDVLNYEVKWQIVDGAKWVPQHRERIFIVGYDPYKISMSRDDIVIPEGPEKGYAYPELKKIIKKKVDDRYTLGPGTWDTLERHLANPAARGNGFGYGLHQTPIRKGDVTRTISARYHKDGAEILIAQKEKRPRRLTPEEAMQLQGYNPKRFVFPVSNTQAYRQIGNSVVVPAIAACAKEIATVLRTATS